MPSATTSGIKLAGQTVHISPNDIIGEGGEAEIYRLSDTTVLKLFKPHRVGAYDQKLTQLPSFPINVVAPRDICHNDRKQICGYTMAFIDGAYHLKQLCDRSFRSRSGIADTAVVDIYRQLHYALSELHAEGIVVGDFNPLNVFVKGSTVFLLDADSMQWANFYCDAFTPRYADPLLCASAGSQLTLIQPHNTNSDWYAFALLLFESLMYVHPYGGVYKPGTKGIRVSPDARSMHRISVLHPDVVYPSAAVPLSELPPAVLEYFNLILNHDRREPFPIALLDKLQGRISAAPILTSAAPGTSASHVDTRVRRVFHTNGVLIEVAVQSGRLRYVHHENDLFMRDGSKPLMGGGLDYKLHFALDSDDTIVTREGQTFVLGSNPACRLPVELYRDRQPVVASNGTHRFWIAGGELWCSDGARNIHIDSVISKQTRIWVGAEFGLGFAQAGQLTRVFLFSDQPGRTPVEIPNVNGRVLDVKCHMGGTKAWLLLLVERQKGAPRACLCLTIDRSGEVVACAEALDDTPDSWLNFAAGKCAAVLRDDLGNAVEVLFAATSKGIAEVRARKQSVLNFQFEVSKIHPVSGIPTETMNLASSPDGLIAYDNHSIYVITNT